MDLVEAEPASCRETRLQDADCMVHATVDGQQRLFEARRASREGLVAQLRERVTQTEREIVSLQAQAGAVQQQIGFLARELESYRELFEQNLTSLNELMGREREAANLEGQAGDIGARIAAGRSRIAEIELQVLQIDSQRMEQAESEARELQARENEIRERLASVRERLAQLEIRAPVGGEVFDMRVFAPAEVLQPGEAVLNIVPNGASMVVRALVAPIHIDQVRRGQEATVLFPAFAQRTTPMFEGQVVQVAADASEDTRTGLSWYEIEVAIGPPIGANEDTASEDTGAGLSWYETEVAIGPPIGATRELSAQAADIGGLALAPGMPAEVQLRTGERSPLSYLLKPLTDYFSRALREE